MHPPKSSPDDVFTVTSVVPGEKAAGPVSETGCKMVHPA
jgi:branched-chain amino acid transport system substrate-binding protein